MPEEQEVETSELQEAIDEIHKERGEREEQERTTAWTRYIGLTTAILAVFAAVGALRSGGLVNEAMISQLKASDTWNEYQSARQKVHLYTVEAYALIDRADAATGGKAGRSKDKWAPKSTADRAKDYEGQVKTEDGKAKDLSKKAEKFEKEAEHLKHGHEQFATSVAFIQVAIALGAISALTKLKPVWIMSIVVGLGGFVAFVAGFLTAGF